MPVATTIPPATCWSHRQNSFRKHSFLLPGGKPNGHSSISSRDRAKQPRSHRPVQGESQQTQGRQMASFSLLSIDKWPLSFSADKRLPSLSTDKWPLSLSSPQTNGLFPSLQINGCLPCPPINGLSFPLLSTDKWPLSLYLPPKML